MASREEVSYPILKKHDVDYVLIIFGGLIGFSGDDINKYLWMIRIAQGVWPNEVKESDYFTPRGEYKVDDQATPTMRESLMYKMSYYRYVTRKESKATTCNSANSLRIHLKTALTTCSAGREQWTVSAISNCHKLVPHWIRSVSSAERCLR